MSDFTLYPAPFPKKLGRPPKHVHKKIVSSYIDCYNLTLNLSPVPVDDRLPDSLHSPYSPYSPLHSPLSLYDDIHHDPLARPRIAPTSAPYCDPRLISSTINYDVVPQQVSLFSSPTLSACSIDFDEPNTPESLPDSNFYFFPDISTPLIATYETCNSNGETTDSEDASIELVTSQHLFGETLLSVEDSSSTSFNSHLSSPSLLAYEFPEISSQSLSFFTMPTPDSTTNPDRKIMVNSSKRRERDADLTDATQKIFICAHCDRSFKRHEHLKRHFRSLHTREKPFKCHKCPKSFSRSDNLSQHMRIHKPGGKINDQEYDSECSDDFTIGSFSKQRRGHEQQLLSKSPRRRSTSRSK
ncbi:hypothetical protein V1514DRAFT_188188 [Lipomyces japonicus]|uniref:uncharacterized protein n=1 Tax=Lipomyces japonicus TaxID=56871 RepID=UPI0034CFB2D0